MIEFFGGWRVGLRGAHNVNMTGAPFGSEPRLAYFPHDSGDTFMNLRIKLAVALIVAAAGFGFATSGFATTPACQACQNAWQECGGGQNDQCTMRYEICLRRNGCPPLY